MTDYMQGCNVIVSPEDYDDLRADQNKGKQAPAAAAQSSAGDTEMEAEPALQSPVNDSKRSPAAPINSPAPIASPMPPPAAKPVTSLSFRCKSCFLRVAGSAARIQEAPGCRTSACSQSA